MNAETRKHLLNVLEEFGERCPDWRFGQMVSNLASWVNNEAWAEADDEPLLAVARRHLDKRFGNAPRATPITDVSRSTRGALLRTLDELGSHFPDWQLVRLVSKLATLAHVNIYDIEDEQLLEIARSKDPGLHWFNHYTEVLEHKSTICEPRDGVVYPCPCCHYLTLGERGGFEICPVCFWEDDGQDDADADTVRGGPNGWLSLTHARENYGRIGASDPKRREHVRPPRPEEQPRLAEQPAVASNSQGASKK